VPVAEQWNRSGGGEHALRFCDCGRAISNRRHLRAVELETAARRALELSLSPDGGTSDENWLRAVHELDAQYGRYP
jgi:hypothetical protein